MNWRQRLVKAKWEEGKHPRADDGRFGTKAGSHGTMDAGDPLADHKEKHYGGAVGKLDAYMRDSGLLDAYGSMLMLSEKAKAEPDKEKAYRDYYKGVRSFFVSGHDPDHLRELDVLHTKLRVAEWRSRPKEGKSPIVIPPHEPEPEPVDPLEEHKKAHYSAAVDKIEDFARDNGVFYSLDYDEKQAFRDAGTAEDKEAAYKTRLNILRKHCDRVGLPEAKKEVEAFHTRMRIKEYRERPKVEKKVEIETPEIKAFKNDHYEKAWRALAKHVEDAGFSRAETHDIYFAAKAEPDKEKAYNDFHDGVWELMTKDPKGRLDGIGLSAMQQSVQANYLAGLKALKMKPRPVKVVAGTGIRAKIPPLSHWTGTVLIEKAETPLYLAPAARVKSVIVNIETNQSKILARMHGISVAKLHQDCITYLKKILAGRPVSKRIGIDSLEEVIAGGGRIKTQFETGTSDGCLSPERRNEAEHKGLGFADDKKAYKRLRPVYGYISGAGSEASSYGEIELVFNDQVRKRTTVTVGDSLGPMRDDYQCPSPIDDPGVECIDHNMNEVYYERFHKEGWSYMEAQIHGGVSLSEVATVRFRMDCFDYATKQLKPRHKLVEDKLKAMGLKVEYEYSKD